MTARRFSSWAVEMAAFVVVQTGTAFLFLNLVNSRFDEMVIAFVLVSSALTFAFKRRRNGLVIALLLAVVSYLFTASLLGFWYFFEFNISQRGEAATGLDSFIGIDFLSHMLLTSLATWSWLGAFLGSLSSDAASRIMLRSASRDP